MSYPGRLRLGRWRPRRPPAHRLVFLSALVVGGLMIASRAPEARPSVVARAADDGRGVEISATFASPAARVTFAWRADDDGGWLRIGADDVPDDGWSIVWPVEVGDDLEGTVRATALGPRDEVLADIASRVAVTPPPTLNLALTDDLISPNADGRRDAVTVRLATNKPAVVRVRFVPARGGKPPPPVVVDADGALRFRWPPRDLVVRDGAYRVEAQATDRGGATATAAVRLHVDTAPPRIELRPPRPDPVGTQRVLRFPARLTGRARGVVLVFEVRDRLGRVALVRVAPRATSATSIAWRARYANGKTLPAGRYEARLVARDVAGNRAVARARFRVHRPGPARVFSKLPRAGRRVALTFDDCYNTESWARILDVLRAKRVKATFFCVGKVVAANPDLVRRTSREGHAIGAHGWDHRNLMGEPAAETAWRLRSDERAWWEIARDTTAPYVRPPYGAYDEATLEGASRAAHTRVIMWDVDPSDWIHRPVDEVVRRVVDPAERGSFILMHTEPPTAAALPAIIDGLRARGLRPVTLPAMFRAAGLR